MPIQSVFSRSENVIDPTTGAQQALNNVGSLLGQYATNEYRNSVLAQNKEQMTNTKAQADAELALKSKEYGIKEKTFNIVNKENEDKKLGSQDIADISKGVVETPWDAAYGGQTNMDKIYDKLNAPQLDKQGKPIIDPISNQPKTNWELLSNDQVDKLVNYTQRLLPSQEEATSAISGTLLSKGHLDPKSAQDVATVLSQKFPSYTAINKQSADAAEKMDKFNLEVAKINQQNMNTYVSGVNSFNNALMTNQKNAEVAGKPTGGGGSTSKNDMTVKTLNEEMGKVSIGWYDTPQALSAVDAAVRSNANPTDIYTAAFSSMSRGMGGTSFDKDTFDSTLKTLTADRAKEAANGGGSNKSTYEKPLLTDPTRIFEKYVSAPTMTIAPMAGHKDAATIGSELDKELGISLFGGATNNSGGLLSGKKSRTTGGDQSYSLPKVVSGAMTDGTNNPFNSGVGQAPINAPKVKGTIGDHPPEVVKNVVSANLNNLAYAFTKVPNIDTAIKNSIATEEGANYTTASNGAYGKYQFRLQTLAGIQDKLGIDVTKPSGITAFLNNPALQDKAYNLEIAEKRSQLATTIPGFTAMTPAQQGAYVVQSWQLGAGGLRDALANGKGVQTANINYGNRALASLGGYTKLFTGNGLLSPFFNQVPTNNGTSPSNMQNNNYLLTGKIVQAPMMPDTSTYGIQQVKPLLSTPSYNDYSNSTKSSNNNFTTVPNTTPAMNLLRDLMK